MTRPPVPPTPPGPAGPPVRPGQVITVDESDYMFGLGRLTLQVTEVGGLRVYDGDTWIVLRGIQVVGSGIQVGQRTALVRLSALEPGQQPTASRDGTA